MTTREASWGYFYVMITLSNTDIERTVSCRSIGARESRDADLSASRSKLCRSVVEGLSAGFERNAKDAKDAKLPQKTINWRMLFNTFLYTLLILQRQHLIYLINPSKASKASH